MTIFPKDRYQGVVVILLGSTLLGTAGAVAGGVELVSPILFAVAITLGISSGILYGVAAAQNARTKPAKLGDEVPAGAAPAVETPESKKAISGPKALNDWLRQRLQDLGQNRTIRVYTAISGWFAIAFILFEMNMTANSLSLLKASLAALLCLIAAGLSATAARYLREVDPAHLPESPGLCRLSRMLMWVLVMAGISMGFAWMAQETVLRAFYLVVLAVDASLCYGLLAAERPEDTAPNTFSLNLRVLSLLGSRTNILASILDTAERQLGVDLRSTWALTIVRRSVEPVVMALCFLGWLSTSLTIVRVDEQALVERLGVQVQGEPLSPGLHLHWPWPIDHVLVIPVQHVQTLTVGHEGEEEGGPEDVLWARQHAANEYTLLLGNGRDLITVDAAVEFRIKDARAWLYDSQNPAEALRAIAYRAVMKSTVNRTLSDALSQNVVKLTARMRGIVQKDADTLGLGVEVLAFTVGGMHPPVPVASDYEAVVSAELGKVTSVVNAQAYRNQIVPAAGASVLASQNTASAEGAQALARAAGEAWSFRTLESQYHAAREEYLFRRRLEALEKGLGGRGFTVVDSRIQRDGGELWLMP
jgi:regulator of protease activity HflC (stomatin/prohibitin superfamily)